MYFEKKISIDFGKHFPVNTTINFGHTKGVLKIDCDNIEIIKSDIVLASVIGKANKNGNNIILDKKKCKIHTHFLKGYSLQKDKDIYQLKLASQKFKLFGNPKFIVVLNKYNHVGSMELNREFINIDYNDEEFILPILTLASFVWRNYYIESGNFGSSN